MSQLWLDEGVFDAMRIDTMKRYRRAYHYPTGSEMAELAQIEQARSESRFNQYTEALKEQRERTPHV